MSEQTSEQSPSTEVPNVHDNAVTGLGHQPVQGATATGYAEPETVDHPTSGNPDATPEEQAADSEQTGYIDQPGADEDGFGGDAPEPAHTFPTTEGAQGGEDAATGDDSNPADPGAAGDVTTPETGDSTGGAHAADPGDAPVQDSAAGDGAAQDQAEPTTQG